MTALWGPLGWMTLHSISLLYPEVPSNTDKQILKRFMVLFQDTISCPSCHKHFKVIFENYVRRHPEWADSRFNLFLFVSIAHNTVNNRLNKPKPASVQACLDMFANNTKITPASVYRQKYMEYLARNWGREFSGEGMMRIAEVRELRKIMNEYWNTKTDESAATFNKSVSVLDLIDDTPEFRSILTPAGSLAKVSSQSMQIGFKGGRFRIRQ